MDGKTWALWGLVLIMTGCTATSHKETLNKPIRSLKEAQARAERFGSVIAVPEFETTPEAIRQLVDRTIRTGNAALDEMARLDRDRLTFDDTVRALDDLHHMVGTAANRLAFIKETSPNAALREAATEALKTLQEWAVGIEYREDVYQVIRAYADTKPQLFGEDAKLLEETLRDYRRAGLHLPRERRDQIEQWRKELARLSTDFDTHITRAQKALRFTRNQLEGVPESFLNQPGIRTGPDEYTIQVNVTWQYLMIMENARREDVRRQVETERYRLAREENAALVGQILALRDRIAKALGYAHWADYQIEPKMAKTATRALTFLQETAAALQPRFEEEKALFQAMKARDTGDPQAQLHIWDWRYYANQLKKERYQVDAEQLRVYFPYQRVLEGMFRIYERIFELRFDPIEPPWRWVPEIQLYAVSDAVTGEPLGLFYLDMFPREGKFNHFAQFGLIEGKLLPDGRYQRPTVALVCNFPPPRPDRPSLLSHAEVETLFHEFGHAMHSILTRAKYSRFAGTSVPRDFVEAPSQMLENWVWDKTVLDSFAGDYRDPSRKIPREILQKLKDAKKSSIAHFYRRQFSFGIMDLVLHTRINEENAAEAIPLANRVLGEVFYPMPEDTTFITYFGHFTGYDAGYYGYAWADVIAADMATVFEQAPEGYLDVSAGRRLRREIYEPGDSRDVNLSVERFLGRPVRREPFLRELGILTDTASAVR
ncbi:Zn-dependent oligopeptidase [Limisphaera ngatamarikiensis]|uniref:Zn-dependent oligopeptidase n=1 Tax=Limisphaera ngatamarikiensis TaxID=1324935 RepID=A0A6M1RG43_9BACT|nr:M3 family metallopeptidase [Limisphaera ngatamarikiensis]NGO39028.1 Zn-dependent oligopeptidase [Limisphaera ngatamarikiensis]